MNVLLEYNRIKDEKEEHNQRLIEIEQRLNTLRGILKKRVCVECDCCSDTGQEQDESMALVDCKYCGGLGRMYMKPYTDNNISF